MTCCFIREFPAILYLTKRGQRISKGGGPDLKCCVQENFEKLTLSGAFSDHFLQKGGGAQISGYLDFSPEHVRRVVIMEQRKKLVKIQSIFQLVHDAEGDNRMASRSGMVKGM